MSTQNVSATCPNEWTQSYGNRNAESIGPIATQSDLGLIIVTELQLYSVVHWILFCSEELYDSELDVTLESIKNNVILLHIKTTIASTEYEPNLAGQKWIHGVQPIVKFFIGRGLH